MGQVRPLVDPKLVAAGHYQCARCRGIFRVAISDEDARKEEAEYFGRNDEGAQMVCEPCFSAIEHETIVAEQEAKRKELAKTQFTRAQRAAAIELVEKTLAGPVEVGGNMITGGLTMAELVEYATPTLGALGVAGKNVRLLMSSARSHVYNERAQS